MIHRILALIMLALAPLAAAAQPPEAALSAAADEAYAIYEQRERNLVQEIGGVSFGPEYDPVDGRLKVTSGKGETLYPKAHLITVFDLGAKTMYWGWSAPETRGFLTDVSEELRARASEPGMNGLAEPELTVNSPGEASGFASMAVSVNEGEFLQFFQYGRTFYYVLLEFDGGTR